MELPALPCDMDAREAQKRAHDEKDNQLPAVARRWARREQSRSREHHAPPEQRPRQPEARLLTAEKQDPGVQRSLLGKEGRELPLALCDLSLRWSHLLRQPRHLRSRTDQDIGNANCLPVVARSTPPGHL